MSYTSDISAEKVRRFNAIASRIQQRFPKIKIRYKSDYWFWKALPYLKKTAMVLGNTIWLPGRTYNYAQLAHEYQHIVDVNNMGQYGFKSMYLAPQILAIFPLVLCLLALMFSQWAIVVSMVITILILLLPWPSKSRTYLEMRGYMMNLYIGMLDGLDMEKLSNIIVDTLTSPIYYKMVWRKKEAKEIVNKALEVLSGIEEHKTSDTAFQDIHEIFNNKTII